ncbi:MAG: hypothetical protein V4574_16085 [Pseudomonadota bacterium]
MALTGPEAPPPPRDRRWEAVAAAGTFAFGGGLVSLFLLGMTALLMGPSFDWSTVSGFVTICAVAIVAGAPILVIDRRRHARAGKGQD